MRFLFSWLLLAAVTQAHYKFPRLIIDGVPETADWLSVRKTRIENARDNGAVSNVNSPDMKCFGGSVGTRTAAVVAGKPLGFVASGGIMHFGPCLFYMAKVPESANINTWDPAGNVWFKVGEISAVQNGGPLAGDEKTWPAYHQKDVFFTMPANVPNGQYLVRVESIGLHLAQNPGGAQIYIACAQVNVTGGGNGTPGPLVAFPGAYKPNDAGLLWPYSPPRTSYTAPGPAIWS